jgi:integrase/recombinase XerD
VPTITVEHGKGDKQRQVTFAEAGYRAVLRYRNVAQPTGRLLLSSRGKPLSRRAAQYVVGRLGGLIGHDGLHPHTLRHSYGTRLARAGVPLPAVQASMGHASLTTTSIYLHADRGWVNVAVAVDPLMEDAT